MAYPRRESRRSSHPVPPPNRRTSSSEDDSPSLAPPRPFFLGSLNSTDRGSWSAASSQDTTSLDPASDSDRDQPPPPPAPARPPRSTHVASPRTHKRKPSSMSNQSHPSAGFAQVDAPESDQGQTAWAPEGLYQDAPAPSPTTPGTSLMQQQQATPRHPPSSFAFPFQAYPGNPDPGLSIPGSFSRRRSSLESVPGGAGYHPLSSSGSLTDLKKPAAPFMHTGANGSDSRISANSSTNSLYRNSVAANMMSSTPSAIALHDGLPSAPPSSNGHGQTAGLPRVASTQFRAPFLSPNSRPSSTVWNPPQYNHQLVSFTTPNSPNESTSALAPPALRKKAPLPSTRLAAPLDKSEKPWLSEKEPRARTSWWLTFFCIFLGLAGAAVICWQGVSGVHKLDTSSLCIVLDEEFDGSSLDDSVWNMDIQLGGFGNGEFQMTTGSSNNLYLQNSQLYITPTLTSDTVSNIFDGGSYTLDGCTSDNSSACSVSSSAQDQTVINPVMSARINTKGKKSIRYGVVEVKAKMPRGDWLWPAIWMLPENDTYGAWPASGEIDIVEARGNGPTYPAQGSNFVRSTLNYGPLDAAINQIFGWQSLKRSSFDQDFHVYALEWDEKFIRFYVDSRIHAMLDLSLVKSKDSFWNRGGFPETAQNGSAEVVVVNPYEGRPNSAPYDQPFYMIIDLAAGGTSGWFPDTKGNKPWHDGSLTAMSDFAKAQSTWSATWPSSANDRSLRVDYVKMWSTC